jgi:hypothetical protein
MWEVQVGGNYIVINYMKRDGKLTFWHTSSIEIILFKGRLFKGTSY